MVTSLRNRHPHSSIEEGAEINLCHDKPSPRRGHYHRIRWSSSILLFLLIAIVGIQAGSKPWLVFRTGLITDLHRHLGRVLYSRMWGMANQVQAEIPEKRAAQLLHINCTFETTRRFPAAFKELDSCANMSYSRASKAAKPNTKEWNQWVTSEGTKHAPFQVSRLPGDQEFPEYQSKSPCGIHQVKKSTTGRFGHQVVAAGSEADIKGTALVVEADSESNLGHSLRAGLCICTYLLHSNLQKDGHLPLTLYIWWDAHSQPSLAVRSFKIQMLSALGEVRAYTEDEPDQPPKVLKHERVYEAPWNGNPLWHDWALVGGPVQLFFGERVNRLSMSSIVVNREPLKMYKGFAAAIRKGLQVPAREVSEGIVTLIKRGAYASAPDHLRSERAKQRLLVDLQTGTPEGLTRRLCHAKLPLVEVDFHPSAKISKLKDQMEIMASTAVLVGSHGSGLWNAIWMRPDSIVVEVTLRAGHCCFPIPLQNQGTGAPVCKSPCRPYTMINIADGIMAVGLQWYYYDAPYIDQPTGDSNRDTTRVHVDGKEFTTIVRNAYSVATGRCTNKRSQLA